jgi:hypothetical protein
LKEDQVKRDEPLLAVDEEALVPRLLVVDERAEEVMRSARGPTNERGVVRPIRERLA